MIKFKQLKQLFSLIFCFLCSGFSTADEINSNRQKINYQLPRINSNIQVDAVLDEAVWQQALKIMLNYETSPAENSEPPVKTEVYLFENGETLYVAFNAYDSDPKAIRAYLSDRDNIWESDFVGIKFDTFGESRKVFQFFTNALGVQADATEDDSNGDDVSWDAIWNSMGKVTKTGYIVEMAIPFKALRFPDTGKEQSWGLEILRFLPRDVRHRIANSPVDRDISCRFCQFDKLIGFSNIKPSQNLRLIPTLVMGKIDSREDPATQGWTKGNTEQNMGLDFRWGITQDIVLNATLNPDFSQVEADSAQLDINNNFSIFFQEKRPFFLDGAEYFESQNSLVHTRDVVEPDYGIKLTGQTNSHSYGLFTVNDQHTSFLLPGNQSSTLVLQENRQSKNQVLRYSLDLGNKNNVGVLATNRIGDDYSNQVVAIDGKYWFDQNHSLSAQYMTSDSTYSDEVLLEYIKPERNPNEYNAENEKYISDDAFTVNFKHDSRNWWGYLIYQDFGENFRADLGFLSKVNYNKKIAGLGHRWYPKNKNSWWKEISIGGDWDITHDMDGLELEKETEANIEVEGILQSVFGGGFANRRRYFDKDQTDLLSGEYFDEKVRFVFALFQPVEGLNLEMIVEKNDVIDFSNSQIGESFNLLPKITWQIGKHWNSLLEYEKIDFDVAGGDLFDAKVLNFRLTFQINIQSFVRITLQDLNIKRDPTLYIEAVDETFKSRGSQFLYSYKINPQTLFFAGYASEGFQDDQLASIRKTGKSLFLKFSYAWDL